MGKKKPSVREEEGGAAVAAAGGGGGGKSKKKNLVIDDDEYSVVSQVSEEAEVQEEKAVPMGGKKKGKKGNAKKLESKANDEDDDDITLKHVEEDEDEIPMQFGGKKKSKGKKSGSTSGFSGFGLLGEDEDEDIEDEVSGLTEDEGDNVVFTGKKKASKSKKGDGKSVFSALDDEDNNEDEALITFTGKKKKSSKSAKTVTILDDDASVSDVDDEAITFSGKKKPSKKKISDELIDTVNKKEEIIKKEEFNKKEEVIETSKNKKKKKKGGRTVQEEDELDKILAELGETASLGGGAPPSKEEKVEVPPPLEEKAEVEEKEAEESAAAKKKKKKKEKEKEKKAALASAVEEKKEDTNTNTKSKGVIDKKVPKHVREMQERLAKMKEAEDKKKREEEEKLRKEEEERIRIEELEKQAEEKKRIKKEREKEKLLKKKQEGKLLTGKQKEEKRRLEAMRNQILGNASESLLTEDKPIKKKPIYQTKKTKTQQSHTNGASLSPTEIDLKEEEEIIVEKVHIEEKKEEKIEKEKEKEKEEEIEEEEEEEDWDAKSWDEADLKLPSKSAFADEEIESETEHEHENEPEPLIKKEVKTIEALPQTQTQTQTIDKKMNTNTKKKEKEEAKKSETNQNESNLRSPICCIMGHVDTGKTKLLDCIRGTNVQEGEAGGITQQIGATYFPAHNIRERTKELKADAKLNVPGLLVIDTPGHESFTNLRSRGSGLCDIAILVVDIMHGLEPQTIESLNLLKMRNTEFVVALNKVDRLYGWKSCRNAPITKAMKQQSKDVLLEFNSRLTQVITQFKEQGLNTELYYKNKDMGETFSIVPTSAISGEGIPDLLLLLCQWTQKTMTEKLTFINEVQCTVLEVKVVEGHGTTIDVVLVNGVLRESDQIVVCGMQGPIVTSIRALLTPHPMKELRVKGTFLHHKEIKAAQGIKITAQGLEHAIAGTSLYVVGPNDDVDDIKESAMEDMKSVMNRIDKSGEGVYVQASTLGSLEALLEFLKTPAVNIPVSGIGIGPVHKKDVMKASVMLEKKKEYATILAFDVKVTPEARELADELGVTIFLADIIYHLFDQFKAYIDNLKEERKKESAEEAVFPCVLKIMPNCVFNKKDPIVLGVDVLEGIAKVGTPICIPQREFIEIGRIASIENNHKQVDYAKKGQKVAIKIVAGNADEQQKMYGRHFEIEDELVSRISRKSIDVLKENYRNDLSIDEWKLVVKLKTLFKIQ